MWHCIAVDLLTVLWVEKQKMRNINHANSVKCSFNGFCLKNWTQWKLAEHVYILTNYATINMQSQESMVDLRPHSCWIVDSLFSETKRNKGKLCYVYVHVNTVFITYRKLTIMYVVCKNYIFRALKRWISYKKSLSQIAEIIEQRVLNQKLHTKYAGSNLINANMIFQLIRILRSSQTCPFSAAVHMKRIKSKELKFS